MNKLYIFIFLIFSITFFPSFGALDKGNTHWFLLSLTPLFFYKAPLNFTFLKSKIFLVYIFFIAQVILSLLYTNNFSISVIDLSRHLILFVSLCLLLFLLHSRKFSFYNISLIISFFLLYESIASLSPLFNFIFDNGFDFSIISSIQVDSLKGVMGNRNITTASLVIKLPFLFYLIYQSKSLYKVLFACCVSLPTLSLFLINSRAALLSFLFTIVVLLFITLFFHKKKLFSFGLILLPLLLSFLFANSLIPESNLDTSERLSSINFSNESSSQRFFLWENAFDYISQNPFIGCGIGNWKVESAAYWGSYGHKYLVPFHAHNDFLEFTTELGIIGGLSYLLLFLFILYNSLKLYIKSKDFKFVILFTSFTAIFVDSLLNFPFERPLIQLMFLLLLALNIHYDYSNDKKQA